MTEILTTIAKAYTAYANYFWKSVTHPFFDGDLNYFYYLIVLSLIVWGLEIVMPWRKEQAVFRKDFFLDTFYMFFNFFFFNLIVYVALSKVSEELLWNVLNKMGLEKGGIINLKTLPNYVQMLLFFVIADFVSWLVHNVLHRVPFLWKFHKVHHSVKEMGFAAHLRYHFVESLVYDPVKYISLSVIFGFDLQMAFLIHMFTILIGHINHANLGWGYGVFGKLINNPKMHIWHHSKELPTSHAKGMNFGITLSCWDYIFKTAYIPSNGRDIELGFNNDEDYQKGFIENTIQPFRE